MKQIRTGTFETNSSSTHSLVVTDKQQAEYIPLARHIKINWIDTDDYYILETLEEKASYLISYIANKIKYSCNNYEELLDEIKDNFEFKGIEQYIKDKFNKEIRFPENKDGIFDDVEYIAEINHQLIPWGTGLVVGEVLDELTRYMKDNNGDYVKYCKLEEENELSFEEMLDIYFKDGSYISFGRD